MHFGSLIAAAGSYLNAKAAGGAWLLRIEDIDKPRIAAGATNAILRALERYGFEWDGEIFYQSARLEAYQAVLERLEKAGQTYRCYCSRSEIAANAVKPGVYPGTCRHATPKPDRQYSIRLRVPDETFAFNDLILGEYAQNLEREVGDFVLLRADGEYAYQLAVLEDDAFSGVTEVVRGGDLLDSTPRQIYLQQRLGYPTPVYAHLPLALGHDGQKLSKQNLARPLDLKNPSSAIWLALDFLGQNPPAQLKRENPQTLWGWALKNWRIEAVPKRDRLSP